VDLPLVFLDWYSLHSMDLVVANNMETDDRVRSGSGK